MFCHILAKRFWNIIAWSLVALALNGLLLLPFKSWLIQMDYDELAFAQTGPPDDTATPPPTATVVPTSIPTSTPLPAATNAPPTPIIIRETTREEVIIHDRLIGSMTAATGTVTAPTATFTPLPTFTPGAPATTTSPVTPTPVVTTAATVVVTATPTLLPPTSTLTPTPLPPSATPTTALLLPLLTPTLPLPTLIPSPEPTPPAEFFAGTWSPWWLFLAMLAGLLGVIGLFLLWGGGRALASLLQPGPVAATTAASQPDGLVLVCSPPVTGDGMAPMRVSLAHLPGSSEPADSVGHDYTAGRLNLPDLGLTASVKRTRPGILRHRGSVVLPPGINLLSWNGHGLRQPAGVVYAGYLYWHGQEEGFSRLYELHPGSTIEVRDQPGDEGLYTVENVQSYQADAAAVVDVPLTGPGNRLLLIAWSESYDIDQVEYRDYLVLQASQAGVVPAGPPVITDAGTTPV